MSEVNNSWFDKGAPESPKKQSKGLTKIKIESELQKSSPNTKNVPDNYSNLNSEDKAFLDADWDGTDDEEAKAFVDDND